MAVGGCFAERVDRGEQRIVLPRSAPASRTKAQSGSQAGLSEVDGLSNVDFQFMGVK
jgi:hypothetical protein